jgi:hypothetical protein
MVMKSSHFHHRLMNCMITSRLGLLHSFPLYPERAALYFSMLVQRLFDLALRVIKFFGVGISFDMFAGSLLLNV